MIKIKKHKKINEDNYTDFNIDKSYIKSINDTLDTLITQKKINLKKLYSKSLANSGITIPLHKLNVPIIVDVDGRKEEIIPAQIASYCEMAKNIAMGDSDIGVIISKFQKPILWTLNPGISTAACDGIRIVFNPIFAQKLIAQGSAGMKEQLKSKSMNTQQKHLAISKYFLFVLMHEAYHSLYRHMESAERKEETMGGKNHELANVAMDAEINRDIENQFPQYKGCTNAINGILDSRFPVEVWQDIFDAYYYKNTPPPAHEDEKQFEENELEKNQDNKDKKIKPKEQRQKEGGGPQPPQPEFSDDFKKGWSDAIKDVVSDKVDPVTYSPRPNITDYNKGYNAAMENMKEGIENGIDIPSGGSSQKQDENGLQEIPWDIENTDQTPPSAPQPGDNNSNSQNNQNDSDSNSDSQNQNGQNGSNSDSQNQNGQNSSNMDSGSTSGAGSENQDGIQDGQTQSASGENGEGEDNSDINTPTNMNGKSSDYQRGYQDELNKELKKMGIDVPQTSQPGQFTNSDEEKAGREQARKDIKNIEQQITDKLEDAEESKTDEDALAKQYEGTTIKTSESNVFGGADIVPRSEMAKIAAEQGQAYTSEELSINRDDVDRDFQKKVLSKINNPILTEKLTNINDKLKSRKSLADWRTKLKAHFREAMKGKTEMTRSRKLLAQSWRADRANPYKERQRIENLGANIFYLIDNSGSMYGYGGNDVFYQIFKEIVTIEKTCKVLQSARAYFTSSAILPQDVEMWDIKTPVKKVLDKLADRGSSGGTDIPGNVLSVTKLKKPYYVNTVDKHTTILVFTDGDNNDPRGWQLLKLIPSSIRRDLVFVIINDKNNIFKYMGEIIKQGVSINNIIGINVSEFKNKR